MSYAEATRDVYPPPPGYEYLFPQRREESVGIYPPQTQTRDSYQAYTTEDQFNAPSYQSPEDSSLSFLKGCLAGLCCCCLLEKCCCF